MGLPILDIVNVVGKVVDRVVPDPAVKRELQLELAKLADQEDARASQERVGQMEVNKAEASNSNLFVAGWRPAIGWTCAAGFAYSTMLAPMFHLGLPDLTFLSSVLLGMLGINGGLRTFEKVKGVATEAVKTPVPLALPAPQSQPVLHPSEKCLDLIKQYEGCRLTAYQDSVGIWTIGYGHTKGVKRGMKISQGVADLYLSEDVEEAANAVKKYAKTYTQGQLDALTSFVFNLGVGSFKNSTLLRKHNAGDYVGAKNEFGRWVHAGGKVLKGLVKRRAAEAALYAL